MPRTVNETAAGTPAPGKIGARRLVSPCGRAPPAQRLHLRALISLASLRRSTFRIGPFRHYGSLSRPSPTSRSCLGPRGSVYPPIPPRCARGGAVAVA